MHVIHLLSCSGHAWAWCQQNLGFCIYKSTPILNHEWSCLCWAGQMHSPSKQHILSSLFSIYHCPLSALEIIAWPSLGMQWEMAALHTTHIVGLCYQQIEWQDALLSAFSLCFALTFSVLCISLSHTLFPWSRSLFLSHASHIICVFSFDAEHFIITSH